MPDLKLCSISFRVGLVPLLIDILSLLKSTISGVSILFACDILIGRMVIPEDIYNGTDLTLYCIRLGNLPSYVFTKILTVA